MFNFDGTIVSKIIHAEPELVDTLNCSFSIYETLRFQKDKILFWENHYFRILASLRRFRFNIPKYFNPEYLEKEINKLIKLEKGENNNFLIEIQFFSTESKTPFVISLIPSESFKTNNSQYLIDLYKETLITSGNFSNFSVTNRSLRFIAKKYAEENGLNDVVLINENKQIVETPNGTLYLIQEDKIFTASLESGCQDFAIRNSFNNWLKKENISFQFLEKNISPFELQKSEEIFVLSIQNGIQNITNYRKSNYEKEKSKKLFENFIKYNN